MTVKDIVGLLPIIILAFASVVIMLVIAWRRCHKATYWLTQASLLATLVSLSWVSDVAGTQITPLIIMDRFSIFLIAVLTIACIAITQFSFDYFNDRNEQKEEYYLLLVLALLGAVVMVAGNHFVSFFLGLEILGICLYAMVAYPLKQTLCLEAGVKYLILSAVASAFLLFGMALIYASYGSLSFEEIGRAVEADDLYFTVGMIAILCAVAFKLSLTPFHMWTPDVYEGAPAPVTTFLATISKGAVVAVFLRFFIDSNSDTNQTVMTIMMILAAVSIIAGNVLALLQTNVKRLLAYSSIAHMGYLLVALLVTYFDNHLGSEAVTYYVVAYILMSLTAFGVVSAVTSSQNSRDYDNIDDYTGFFWRKPLYATVLTVALFSLAGIPLTVGFIGKFYVFTAGVSGGLWLLLFVLIVGSAIGIYYYLRIILAMTQNPGADAQAVSIGGSMGTSTVLVALAILTLWFGINPEGLIQLVDIATN